MILLCSEETNRKLEYASRCDPFIRAMYKHIAQGMPEGEALAQTVVRLSAALLIFNALRERAVRAEKEEKKEA